MQQIRTEHHPLVWCERLFNPEFISWTRNNPVSYWCIHKTGEEPSCYSPVRFCASLHVHVPLHPATTILVHPCTLLAKDRAIHSLF